MLGFLFGSMDTEVNIYSLTPTDHLKCNLDELKDMELCKQNAMGHTCNQSFPSGWVI